MWPLISVFTVDLMNELHSLTNVVIEKLGKLGHKQNIKHSIIVEVRYTTIEAKEVAKHQRLDLSTTSEKETRYTQYRLFLLFQWNYHVSKNHQERTVRNNYNKVPSTARYEQSPININEQTTVMNKEQFMITTDNCKLSMPETDYINMENKFEKSLKILMG